MEFRTAFSIPPFAKKLTYGKGVFSVGSCFSSLLEDRLSEGKFDILSNPFGIMYNPVSILNLLTSCLRGNDLPEAGVLTYQGRFFHFDLHSSFHASSVQALMQRFEDARMRVVKHLSASSHIFFTWGTSFVHEHRHLGVPVANCHKQPSAFFQKRLLSIQEMMDAFSGFIELLNRINPLAQVVVTVSPVRHTKDGIPENQLSKSMLRVFCHELCQSGNQIAYFPSYEWMVDDLRDYRFYKSDMIHPSEVAENYIWAHFIDAFMEKATKETYDEVIKIKRAMAHKPFFQDSPEYRRFVGDLIRKMERLALQLDFSEEISALKQRLPVDEQLFPER